MMNVMVNDMWIWVAMAALACFSVAVSSYALQNRKRLQILETQLTESLSGLRRDIKSVNDGAIGVGQRLVHLEKRLRKSGEQSQQWQSEGELGAYRQAVALAEQGAEPDQLVKQCGLSESEAQLMAKLRSAGAAH